MIKFDQSTLDEVGLGSLPCDVGASLLQHCRQVLEMRVGMAIAENLSDDQLTEFEAFIERDDEPGALAWLTRTVPDYPDTVRDKFEELKDELRLGAPAVLATVPPTGADDGV